MLASFPGSGNTWTRFLIERSTGWYTGSVAEDKSLYNGGFQGEFEKPDLGTTVVVKAHRYVKSGVGAILLIRNPYEAIMSEFNRKRGHGHTSHASVKEFHTDFWPTLVVKESGRWFNLYRQYIENRPVQIVFFEELKSDLPQALSKIVGFIEEYNNKSINDAIEEKIDCVVADSQGEFKRGKKTLEFDPYRLDESLVPRVNSRILLLNETLQKYNLPTIPDFYLKENKTHS